MCVYLCACVWRGRGDAYCPDYLHTLEGIILHPSPRPSRRPCASPLHGTLYSSILDCCVMLFLQLLCYTSRQRKHKETTQCLRNIIWVVCLVHQNNIPKEDCFSAHWLPSKPTYKPPHVTFAPQPTHQRICRIMKLLVLDYDIWSALPACLSCQAGHLQKSGVCVPLIRYYIRLPSPFDSNLCDLCIIGNPIILLMLLPITRQPQVRKQWGITKARSRVGQPNVPGVTPHCQVCSILEIPDKHRHSIGLIHVGCDLQPMQPQQDDTPGAGLPFLWVFGGIEGFKSKLCMPKAMCMESPISQCTLSLLSLLARSLSLSLKGWAGRRVPVCVSVFLCECV
jgi:hypothetical protein